MRTGLTSHLYALCLGMADDLHAAVGADVCNVNRHIRRCCQNDLTGCDIVLGCTVHTLYAQCFRYLATIYDAAVNNGQILAVRDHRDAQFCCLDQCLAHSLSAFHRSAVIGNGADACLFQSGIIAHFFAFQSLGNASHRVYLYAGMGCLFADIPNGIHAVDRRCGIGHTRYAGNAAGKCRSCAGEDVLFMGLTRITEVNVHIKQARQCRQTGTVDRQPCRIRQVPAKLCDHTVLNQHIASRHHVALYDLHIANQNGLFHSFLISASVF